MKRHQEIGAFTGLVVCDGPQAGTRSASEDGRGVGQESGRANWGENHEAVQTISEFSDIGAGGGGRSWRCKDLNCNSSCS